MNENKTTTYGDLKCRKKELRNIMVNGESTESTIEEYQRVVQAIKNAEARLLWGIRPDESYGELPRRKKCRTGAIVCFVIAGLAAAILVVGLFGCNIAREGCHLVGAAGQDIGWMATKIGDNIQTQEK